MYDFDKQQVIEPKRQFTGVWLPKELLLDKRLTAVDKILYAEITSFGDKGCWKKSEELMSLCGVKKDAFIASCKRLIDFGYITQSREYGRMRRKSTLGFSQQSEKPADEQSEKPADEQSEKPADEQSEKPADEQSEKPADEQSEKPADEQSEKPADEQSEKPADEQSEKPADHIDNTIDNTIDTINSKVSKNLLDLLNEKTKRNFRILPRGYKETLKKFSLEEIGKALDILVEDEWHSKKIHELKSDYLLRASTIDNMLSKRKKQHESMADLDELYGDGEWLKTL